MSIRITTFIVLFSISSLSSGQIIAPNELPPGVEGLPPEYSESLLVLAAKYSSSPEIEFGRIDTFDRTASAYVIYPNFSIESYCIKQRYHFVADIDEENNPDWRLLPYPDYFLWPNNPSCNDLDNERSVHISPLIDFSIINLIIDNEEKIGESMKEYAAQYNDPEIRGNALIASIYNTGGTYEIYVEFDIPCPNNLGPQYLGMAEIKIVNWELEILSRSASMVHCENYTQ